MKAYTKGISKKEFVAELVKHQKADLFLKGTYWDGQKGCAVGCGLHSIAKLKNIELKEYNDHKKYSEHLGIPEWLARLEDTLFEGVSVKRSKTWPVEFAQAIYESADLDKVRVPFLVKVLESSIKSMAKAKYDEDEYPDVKKALAGAKAAVKQMIAALKSGDKNLIEEAQGAANSAYLAANSAVNSANWGRWATNSAANSAYSAAYSAANPSLRTPCRRTA